MESKKQSILSTPSYASSSSLFVNSSQEVRKIWLSVRTFKQLEESQSNGKHEPISETIFLGTLSGIGLDDREAKSVLDLLHSQGQIYEISPHQYKSIGQG